MADNDVTIVGIDGLEEWASEETLSKIYALLDRTEKFDKKVKLEDDKAEKKVDKWQQELLNSNKEVTEAVKSSGSGMSGMLSKLNPKTIAIETAKIGLSAAMASVGVVKNYTDEVYKMYKMGVIVQEKSGGNTAAALESFGKMTRDLHLNSSQVAGIIREHGFMVNQVGMESFRKNMKMMETTAKKYALTNDERAEYTAEYLEGQRLMGTLDDINSKAGMAKQQKTLEYVDKWAKILGKTTVEMEKELNQKRQDAEIRAGLLMIEKSKRAEYLDKASTQMTGGTKAIVDEIISKPVGAGVSAESYKALVAAGQTEIADLGLKIANMYHGTVSSSEQQRLAAISEFNEKMGRMGTQELANVLAQFEITGATYADRLKSAMVAGEEQRIRQEQKIAVEKQGGTAAGESLKATAIVADTIKQLNFEYMMDQAGAAMLAKSGGGGKAEALLVELGKAAKSGEMTIDAVTELAGGIAGTMFVEGVTMFTSGVNSFAGWAGKLLAKSDADTIKVDDVLDDIAEDRQAFLSNKYGNTIGGGIMANYEAEKYQTSLESKVVKPADMSKISINEKEKIDAKVREMKETLAQREKADKQLDKSSKADGVVTDEERAKMDESAYFLKEIKKLLELQTRIQQQAYNNS